MFRVRNTHIDVMTEQPTTHIDLIERHLEHVDHARLVFQRPSLNPVQDPDAYRRQSRRPGYQARRLSQVGRNQHSDETEQPP